MREVWIVMAIYGRLGKSKNLSFESKSQAKKWIYENFTGNTIVEDEIKAQKLYLDTPEKLDRV